MNDTVTLEKEVFIKSVRWAERHVPPEVTVYVGSEEEREAVAPLIGHRVVMSVTYRLLREQPKNLYSDDPRPSPSEEADLEAVSE